MAKIIGNTTATPNPRPDWLQDDPKKADYIKNKPEVITLLDVDDELNFDSTNPIQNSAVAWRFNDLEADIKMFTEGRTDSITSTSTDDQFPTAKATYDFVKTETASLVESAPETLDTLNELAAALGDDPNFATTVATQISQKADKEDLEGVKSYIDKVISEQSQVQIITWEAND